MKRYTVVLNKGVDYQEFWEEMEISTGAQYIPTRKVEVENPTAFTRQCTYYLKEDEIVTLGKDSRVAGVELPISDNPAVNIEPSVVRESGNYSRSPNTVDDKLNWAVYRTSIESNLYGEDQGDDYQASYESVMDGSNVDMVIMDTGIEATHPEFSSRLNKINWYDYTNTTQTQSVDYYTDVEGHGTHCAGIAVGCRYGIAKNSNLYVMSLSDLGNSNGYTVEESMGLLLQWHNRKKINPDTGYVNPTIVNMSFGVGIPNFTSATTITHRGTSVDVSELTSAEIFQTYGLIAYSGMSISSRSVVIDAAVEELLEAGIHVVIAGNNNYMKVDVPGGLDYDNTATFQYYNGLGAITDHSYHRGSSPYHLEAIKVANMDSELLLTYEMKNFSSAVGPGIDIFAPGSNIPSAMSTTTAHTAYAYPDDNQYKAAQLSGTSMAAPHVAGIAALILQSNPTLTPKQVKDLIMVKGKSTIIDSFASNPDNSGYYNYTDNLFGGSSKLIYNPFNKADSIKITN